jgi:hypothetical protein
MRGFLKRLGARALGLAQVVQPIVPTIFDPGHAAGGIPAAEPEQAEPRNDRPTASAAAVPVPGPRSMKRVRRDAREPADWEGPRAAVSEDEREHEHNGRAHDHGRRERAVETLPPAGREAAIVLSAPQEGARPEAADGHWSRPGLSVVPRVAPQPQQPLSRENHAAVGARRDPAAATQGPPVIRVTIGRIDVRADVPTPAPARAATTPLRAPMLSLDDYLKQRNEGKR